MQALQSSEALFACLCVTAKFMFSGLLKSNFKPSNRSGFKDTATTGIVSLCCSKPAQPSLTDWINGCQLQPDNTASVLPSAAATTHLEPLFATLRTSLGMASCDNLSWTSWPERECVRVVVVAPATCSYSSVNTDIPLTAWQSRLQQAAEILIAHRQDQQEGHRELAPLLPRC